MAVMREHLVEILWAGGAESKKTVMDALCAAVRETTSGAHVFLMSVPDSRLREAISAIAVAGGRTLNVRFKDVH